MKTNTKWMLAVLALCAAVLAGIVLSSAPRSLRFSPAPYTESTGELDNPYIGWYRMYGYRLSDSQQPDLSPAALEEPLPELILLELNLAGYADRPISPAGLEQLDQILAAWQSAGKQLILRFLYDWDGNGMDAEPEQLSLVLEHMSQAAQVVNRYADCVYILQGVFVGAWGEMHASRHMADEDLTTLAEHLAQAVDPRIFLAVRTPEQWRTVTSCAEPLTAELAFDGSLAARLGLFNDGMTASETDLGTYVPDGTVPANPYAKRPRQAELLFQNSLCAYVPSGGEAACSTAYNDLPAAIENLAAAHVSYLNGSYSEEVLSKWKGQVYQGRDIFSGISGYDYISRHLGYRYVLRSAGFSPGGAGGVLSVSIENVGFAAAYRPFEVSLVLRHRTTGERRTLQVQADPRTWSAGEETRLDIPVQASALSPGSYDAALLIRDPASGREILLANEGAQAGGEGCPVGALTVGVFP